MRRRSFLASALAAGIAAASAQQLLVGGSPVSDSPALGVSSRFPLAISSNGRYFVDSQANPFFFLMDAGWEAAVQLTQSQIDTYLEDRSSRGFTATILQMTTLLYSNQQPSYENAYGDNPFSVINNTGSPYYLATTCVFSSVVNAYWNNVDYFIQKAQSLGMIVVAFPAYVGYPTTPAQGWYTPLVGTTAQDLQAFGRFIAQRYGGYGNIIWGMAGDNSLDQADLDQDWNIVTGMREVRTDQLIYIKAQRGTSGYQLATTNGGISRYPGFNINNVYIANGSSSYTGATDSATAYAVSPAMPFFCDETDYEGYSGYTSQDMRNGLWTASPLTGCANACFGNGMLWGFGCANNTGMDAIGAAAALTSTYLDTTGAQNSTVYADIMSAVDWSSLVPKTDMSLVTTSLGSGASVICPALTSDATLAMIYTAGGTGFTVNLAALAGDWTAEWVDPTSGATTSAGSGSNSGTQAFSAPGNNAAGDTDWLLKIVA